VLFGAAGSHSVLCLFGSDGNIGQYNGLPFHNTRDLKVLDFII
jgi:hypothetical protein